MAEQTKQARTPPALTSRDHELIVNALTSVKGGIFTIDYELFAAKCGLKNANSARVAWFGVKKKLDSFQKTDGGKSAATDSHSGKKGASGKAKAAGKANEFDHDEQSYEVMLEEDEDAKPAKRTRVKMETE